MPPEFALTEEPVYEGEPILAIAADSEELASEAIERIVVDFEPLPFAIDPIESLRPGSPNGREQGNVFVGPSMKTLKWTPEQMATYDGGKFPNDAEATETAVFGDIEKGFKEADLDRRARHAPADHVAPAARIALVHGLLAERQVLHARLDAEPRAHRGIGRRLGRRQAR